MQNRLSGADRALAKRIEEADASAIVKLLPAGDIFAAEPAAGGWCVFGGIGSPFTHAVGIGMSGPVAEEELDRIEEFYRSRGAACVIDLCPLADPGLVALIHARPYRATEFNNVMARTIEPGEAFAPGAARLAGAEELDLWSRLIAGGFADADAPVESGIPANPGGATCFLAEWEDRAAAGGALSVRDGVAWMYGDATLTWARGHGLQAEMIRARLAHAAALGCDLAVAAVLPGTASHRNYERAGFELVYMRVGVTREFREARP